MKQHFYLRALLVMLLSLFLGIGAYADTSTLTFTAACGGSGTADDGAEWTVTSDAEESSFGGKGIHYGTGSAAVSYLQLASSDINGTITKIVVNASGASETKAKLNVTVGGNAFGSEVSLTSSSTDYTFEGSATGQIIVRLSQTSAKRALYVKSITVTYSTETPSGTENPNNSFGGVEEYNATIGVENNFPTFTTSSDGAKLYSSSNTDVATINNIGVITLLKAGETTITVKTAQTATYAEGYVSYKLIVNKGTPVLSFDPETFTIYLGTNKYGPALTNPGDGAATYAVSPQIATIQSNGYIQPLEEGEATVTVTTAETDAWYSATASYTLKVEKSFSVDAEGTYEWVKEASTLTAGDELIFVYNGGNSPFAMGPQRESNGNFGKTAVSYPEGITDKSIINVSNNQAETVTAIKLERADEKWTFHTNNGYLYAASSSKNQLKTSDLETAGNNAKANISFSGGDATIQFQGTNARNLIRYNDSDNLFSCYSSGQKYIQIYRKVPSNVPPTITFSPASGTEVNYGTQVTITARTATSITYRVNGGEAVTVEGTSATVTIDTHSTITATATNEYGTSDPVTAEYTIHAESPAFTYDPAEYTIIIGDDFTAPELGKAADYDGEVTYSSNNTEVAEVDAETGAVTVKGAGTATITATGTATEHFAEATASYTLTVNKQESSVSFAESVVEITYGDNYNKQAATAEGFSGDLVYTSSDESVVKFHGNNVIDVLKAGTVTITATAPATETTSESSATYTLKIYEPADATEGTTLALDEHFNDCEGSRPTDNPGDKEWNGTNNFVPLPETCNWTVDGTASPAGNGCLKLGTGTNAGDATSPSFTLNGRAPLSFDIAPWTSTSDGTITGSKSVTVTLANATFEDGSNSKTVGNPFSIGWNHFEYNITGSGEVTVNFHGSSQFFLDNVVVGGGAQPAHEINLTFSSAGYLTWVATADIDFSQTDGVTAYKITEATSKKITMEEVNKVPEGAAVMLKGSGTVTLKRTSDAAPLENNKMLACSDGSVTGNGVNGVTNTDVYVLGNGKNGLGFYMLKGTLQAGKGYLKVSESAGNAKQNFIAFEETTGVKTVEANGNANNVIYNLQGVRVANPQKGIYVKNGKKYVIK